MKEPSADDFAELIRKSSNPLLAFDKILLAFPEERRTKLAIELHQRCKDVLLQEALKFHRDSAAKPEKV